MGREIVRFLLFLLLWFEVQEGVEILLQCGLKIFFRFAKLRLNLNNITRSSQLLKVYTGMDFVGLDF